MSGRPVWLASLSYRTPDGVLVGAQDWNSATMQKMLHVLRGALDGLGDSSRERAFRMCVTLCVHRGLTAEEEATLPANFYATPPEGLAGGPIEVIYSRGIKEQPSMLPCAAPIKVPLPGKHWSPGYYFPEDCGMCPSCLARDTIRREAIKEWNANWAISQPRP